jgi:lipopolysaccharide/colanic/teichoic acid biosynthesis glycosyltransferase
MLAELTHADIKAASKRAGRRRRHAHKPAGVPRPTPPAVVERQATRYEGIKAVVETAAAALMLVAFSPLIAVTAVLVRLTSSGPAFYSQIRLGRHGRPYRIWKIRTMTHNCERQSGARWCAPGDARVTPVGRFLRKSHLDELPQLWNVIRGDMSLIGPRPERPEFIPELERNIPRYRERLQVRPGVTGLAQVQLPADTDLDSVRRKLTCDLYYVEHISAWLDVQILLSTGSHILGVPFSLMHRMLGVPRMVFEEEKAVPPTPALRAA